MIIPTGHVPVAGHRRSPRRSGRRSPTSSTTRSARVRRRSARSATRRCRSTSSQAGFGQIAKLQDGRPGRRPHRAQRHHLPQPDVRRGHPTRNHLARSRRCRRRATRSAPGRAPTASTPTGRRARAGQPVRRRRAGPDHGRRRIGRRQSGCGSSGGRGNGLRHPVGPAPPDRRRWDRPRGAGRSTPAARHQSTRSTGQIVVGGTGDQPVAADGGAGDRARPSARRVPVAAQRRRLLAVARGRPARLLFALRAPLIALRLRAGAERAPMRSAVSSARRLAGVLA